MSIMGVVYITHCTSIMREVSNVECRVSWMSDIYNGIVV